MKNPQMSAPRGSEGRGFPSARICVWGGRRPGRALMCCDTPQDEGHGGGLSHRDGPRRTFYIRLRKRNMFLEVSVPSG